MAIQKKECKYCIPIWELKSFELSRWNSDAHYTARPGDTRTFKYRTEIRWNACLKDLVCTERDSGGAMRRLVIPRFCRAPSFGSGSYVRSLDTAGICDRVPFIFQGRVDDYQAKVCCKPVDQPGAPAWTAGPSACCRAKKDIICKCYADSTSNTTTDECCIQGRTGYNVNVLEEELKKVAGSGPQWSLNCTGRVNDPMYFNPVEPPIHPEWGIHCPCLDTQGNPSEKCP